MSRFARVAFVLALVVLAMPVRAAEPLTLSQALDAALRANARLQVARNDRAVAGHENSLGNAGFLPALDATATRSAERGRTTTTPSGGTVTTVDDDADATTLGLRLSWTLFDGGRMFSAKSRLASAEDAAGERLRSVVESTVGSTIAAYFDVVRLQRGVQVLDDAIAVTDERARLAQARFETGAASKLDGLQARVDLDARRSDRARLQVTLEEAMGRLNLLMGVDSFRTFTATDSIRFDYVPDLTADVLALSDRNSDVRLARAGWRADRSRVAEARSGALPRVTGTLDYGLTRLSLPEGAVSETENRAVTGRVALTWNLFDGWVNATEVSRARLDAASSRALVSEAEARFAQQLAVARRRWTVDRDIVRMETDMLAVARENADVALEAYRAGSLSGLQLREAQNSYLAASERLLSARYRAKLSETELMRLNGDLVK